MGANRMYLRLFIDWRSHMENEIKYVEPEECEICGNNEHPLGASHCMICGQPLKNTAAICSYGVNSELPEQIKKQLS